MSEYNKYNDLLFAAIKSFINNVILADKEFIYNLSEYINGKELKHLSRNINIRNKYISDIHSCFVEIQYSMLTLKDTEYYINCYSYKSKKLSRTRSLRYHIENYMQELFILRERLLLYLKKIDRFYRKDHKYADITKRTKHVSYYVEKSFEIITPVRGTHVHQRRIYCPEIVRLEYYDVLATIRKDYIKKHNQEYKKVRRQWVKRIKVLNEAISKLMDNYFYHLKKIIFLPDGSLNYPENIKR